MTVVQARPEDLLSPAGQPSWGHPRLLAQIGADLRSHIAAHGPLPAPDEWGPRWSRAVLGELESSGLTGRGGGGFPAYAKALSVRRAGGQVAVVVNAMEGEPASAKDRVLLERSPHLVLDGASVIATALGAVRVVVCIPDDLEGLATQLRAALTERGSPWAQPSLRRPSLRRPSLRQPSSARRRGAGNPSVELAQLPGRYVAGEESALVAAVSGRRGVPQWRPDKSVPLMVRALGPPAAGQKALVHNAETLANVALIARHGAAWWRSVGDPACPGTALVTVSGDVRRPGVYELETGTPIVGILAQAGPAAPLQAILVGGYGGTWLSPDQFTTPLSPSPLRELGASMGAGVLVALGKDVCGVRETARIARWMAGQSAGQCGPCLFGLPAIAADLEEIAAGTASVAVYERLLRRCSVVTGRGACHHPDGVARMVQSAVRVFAAELRAHLAGAPCTARPDRTVLAVR